MSKQGQGEGLNILDESTFAVMMRLVHFAEVCEAFIVWAKENGEATKTLRELAQVMEDRGSPLGDGIHLKSVSTGVVDRVPIEEVFELYNEQPDACKMTLEEFTGHFADVAQFRHEHGMRGFGPKIIR